MASTVSGWRGSRVSKQPAARVVATQPGSGKPPPPVCNCQLCTQLYASTNNGLRGTAHTSTSCTSNNTGQLNAPTDQGRYSGSQRIRTMFSGNSSASQNNSQYAGPLYATPGAGKP